MPRRKQQRQAKPQNPSTNPQRREAAQREPRSTEQNPRRPHRNEEFNPERERRY